MFLYIVYETIEINRNIENKYYNDPYLPHDVEYLFGILQIHSRKFRKYFGVVA